MFQITFFNSAAAIATVSWKVDRDCELQLVTLPAGSGAVLSKDPAVTFAGIQTNPPFTGFDDRFLVFAAGSQNLKIPFYAGEVLYCAFPATKSVLACYFNEVS